MTNPSMTNRLTARGLLAAALLIGGSSAAHAQAAGTPAVSNEIKPFAVVSVPQLSARAGLLQALGTPKGGSRSSSRRTASRMAA